MIYDEPPFDLERLQKLWNEATPYQRAHAIPETRDELWSYIADEYGYEIPRVAVCKGHVSPFDAIADAFFSQGGEMVWVGPRTGGKTLQAALLEHLIMTHFGDTAAHAGAIEAQAMKCYEYLRSFFGKAQFRDDVLGDSLMSSTILKNGGKVEVLPMTMNRLNSPHTRFLFCDEIELATNTLLNEARSIPMRVNGRAPLTIYTSSRKFAHGPMEDMLRESKTKGTKTHFWCVEGSTLVATENGQRAIRDIRAGERVWSYAIDGSFVLKATTFAARTGRKQTVIIAFSDGTRLKCTPDHEIRCERGWVEAGKLITGEAVLQGVRRSATFTGSESDVRLWRPESPSFECMQIMSCATSRDAQYRRGWSDGVGSESLSWFESFTNSNRDAGLSPVIDAWNRSGARVGDRSATSGLLPRANEDGYRSLRVASQIAKNHGTRQAPNGTSRAPGLSHYRTMVGRNGNVGSYIAGRVFVASVEQSDVVDVYDLTVEDTHNFLANGIVVHNCLFEIIEKCPEERHQNGAPSGCGSCKLEPVCREKETDFETGLAAYVPGPGKAAISDGWYKIDDAIKKYETIEEGTFNSQWLSKKPDTKGLAYPMFDENVHVIDYEYQPAFPVVCGIDIGYTNPTCVLYAQPMANDDIVIFAETYRTGMLDDELADIIKSERWFNNTSWRVIDSAAASTRAALQRRGIANEPANKASTAEEKSSVVAGIKLVRWLLQPQGRRTPILYFARNCVNAIREHSTYHHPDVKDDRNIDERPVSSDDHACDAARYLLTRAYRGAVSA